MPRQRQNLSDAERRKKKREYDRLRRARIRAEQQQPQTRNSNEERRNYMRGYMAQRRAGSSQIRENEAETRRENRQTRIEVDTDFLEAEANRSRSNRSVTTPEIANDNGENERLQFEIKAREGPTIVCGCCACLYFNKDMSIVTAEQLTAKGIELDMIEKVFWPVSEGILGPTNNKLCNTCKRTLFDSKKLPTIALVNGLHFPNVDPIINDLTRLEERLVAGRHVFQSIWTMQGTSGQYRSKGGIVNVPVNVDTTVSALPRKLNDSCIVHVALARRLIYLKDYIKGNIDVSKVWRAANYLTSKSLYLKYNIEIDCEWMNTVAAEIEGEQESSNHLDEEVRESDNLDENVEVNDENVEVNDENVEDEVNSGARESVVVNDHEALRMAPGEGRVPLSILQDKHSDFLSFPKIYCGELLNGIDSMSYGNYAKSVARRFDRRGVERVDYLLYMDRKYQLIKTCGNISTVMRKRKKPNTFNSNNQDQPFRASDFSDLNNINMFFTKDQAYKIFSGVRSSTEYWKNQKKNVLAMVRQFGIPTIFLTLSAAETKWNELLVMLKKLVDGVTISEEQAEALSSKEKSYLLQSDPVTCARYFDYRFRLLKKTFHSKNGPFGSHVPEHYYFRVEFQHRGSPHIHGLFWLKNAPNISSSTHPASAEQVVNFVDSIISCRKEWDGSSHHRDSSSSNDDTWKELIKRQYHKHTRSCLRIKNNQQFCRFNIPFFPMDKTRALAPIAEGEERFTGKPFEFHKTNYKRIKEYLHNNCETMSEGNMTFDEFLINVGITDMKYYIHAIQCSLKTNKVIIKRNPNEVMINNYNTKIFSMFKSNMDIQFVIDPYACCSYIVDYINKADKGMSKALEESYNKCVENNNSSAFDTLRSLSATYYNACEISAQEASYNILQLRMAESSCVSYFIPTAKPEDRMHILKSHEELLKLNADSTDCFEPNLIDHYINRPDELESINLAQFTAYYQYSKKKPRSRSRNSNNATFDENINEDDANNQDEYGDIFEDQGAAYQRGGLTGQVFELKNNDGFIKRRGASKVIRYFKYDLSEENEEDYYRTLIMLYLSWRNEEEELLHGHCKEVYNTNKLHVDSNRKEFNQLDEDALESFISQIMGNREEEEVNNNDDEEEGQEEARVRRTAPGDDANDFRRYTMDVNDSDQGDYHRNVDLNEELGGNTKNSTYFEKIPVPNKLSKTEYNDLMASLNVKQRLYISHVINHIRYNRDNVDISDNVAVANNWITPFSPIYHFVTGGAGTGKSLLIRALHQSLMREFDNNNRDRDLEKPSVILTAFTGRAAFNIFGLTIHSAFNFPVSQAGKNSYNTLSASFAQTMSVALNDLKVIIIDEISMVSDTMFGFIDKRLRDIFNPSIPFGGRTVIVVGDFLQLPPVGAHSLYTLAHEKNGDPFVSLFNENAFFSLFKVHRLNEIMRQRDDKLFAEALNRMAIGMMTQADINLFQSRVLVLNEDDMKEVVSGRKAVSISDDDSNIDDANTRTIHLFFTNNDVQRFNRTILLSMNTEGAVSNAYDIVQGSHLNQQKIDSLLNYFKTTDGITNTICLPRVLLLKIDARYMITTNVNTSDGLVNGITGVLKRIDYGQINTNDSNNPEASSSSTTESERKPLRIWLLFDDLMVGKIARKSQDYLRRNLHIDENWTMMEPRTMNINSHSYKSNLKLMRTQFPIFPAEALTVHKSQGSTFPKVTVYDVANKRMSRSLLYVACSRATTAAGLTLICKENKFQPPVSLFANDSSLRREIERQPTVKLITCFEHLLKNSSSEFKLQIISHNVQSLRAHIDQIKKDQVYLSSNIILLQETWTLDNDENYEIDSFKLVTRVNAPGSQPRALGSCIYVKNDLVTRLSSTDHKLFQQDTNSVSVSLITLSNDLYCSIYATPNCSSQLLIDALQFVIEQHEFENITIAGDFNTDFKTSSRKTDAMVEYFASFGIKSTLSETISSTTSANTFIDNIFSSEATVESGRYISFTSFHEPLWLKIDKSLPS